MAPPGRIGSFNIRRALAIFRRRLLLFSVAAVSVFLLVAMIAFTLRPHYVATAQVLIDMQRENVVDVEQVAPGLSADASTVDTQVEVLRSRSLIEQVTDTLHLDRTEEYKKVLDKSRDASPEARRRNLIDAVAKNLKVARAGLTNVIGVSFRSQSPRLAQQVANSIARLYTEKQVSAKAGANSDATQFLSGRVGELRGQVEAAEAEVARYKAQHGLLSAQGNTLTETDISNLSQQVATARADDAEQAARLNTALSQLRRGSNGSDVGAALDSPVIQQLRSQRAQVSRQVVDLQQRYTPNYPDLVRAQKQLSDIDKQIEVEIQRVISNLDAQSRVAHQRVTSLQGSLNAKQSTLAANNGASVEENELERRAESLRTLYQAFLDRLQQTTAQQGLQAPDAELLSPAEPPSRPATPNIPLMLAAGLALGLVSGAFLAAAVELLDDSLRTAEDVHRQLEIAALPSIPTLRSTSGLGKSFKGSPVDFITTAPLSAFAEAFRNLRTSAFQARGTGRAPRVVAITSSQPGEGKSVTATCLARSMAMSGQSVVLVDCDLRRPSISRLLFRTAPEVGLLEVLDGTATLERALLRDDKTTMFVLPIANEPRTARDICGSPAMEALIQRLRAEFDAIILDTAPVLAVADTRVLAAKVDEVVMLAHWRRTSRNAVREAITALDTVGATVAGVALTLMDLRQQERSGFGDPSYFAKASRPYHVD